jgi:hypothetical protein
MRGDRVVDDGIEYEVIFDGAHHGKDLDLFRAIDVPAEDEHHPIKWTDTMDKRSVRQRVLSLFQEQDRWIAEQLQVEAGTDNRKLWITLQSLKRAGIIEHVGPCIVQLVRGRKAA